MIELARQHIRIPGIKSAPKEDILFKASLFPGAPEMIITERAWRRFYKNFTSVMVCVPGASPFYFAIFTPVYYIHAN